MSPDTQTGVLERPAHLGRAQLEDRDRGLLVERDLAVHVDDRRAAGLARATCRRLRRLSWLAPCSPSSASPSRPPRPTTEGRRRAWSKRRGRKQVTRARQLASMSERTRAPNAPMYRHDRSTLPGFRGTRWVGCGRPQLGSNRSDLPVIRADVGPMGDRPRSFDLARRAEALIRWRRALSVGSASPGSWLRLVPPRRSPPPSAPVGALRAAARLSRRRLAIPRRCPAGHRRRWATFSLPGAGSTALQPACSCAEPQHGSGFATARDQCVTKTNGYRARAQLEPLVRRPDQEACADAGGDGGPRSGKAHGGFCSAPALERRTSAPPGTRRPRTLPVRMPREHVSRRPWRAIFGAWPLPQHDEHPIFGRRVRIRDRRARPFRIVPGLF